MSFFLNLKTRSKLFLSFTLMSLVVAVVGLLGISALGDVNDNLRLMFSDGLGVVEITDQLRYNQAEIEGHILRSVYKYQVTKVRSDLDKAIADIQTLRDYNDQLIAQYSKFELMDTEL